MSGATSVSAEVRYLNPEWKGRAEAPRIGDRTSRRANTAKRAVSIDDARGLYTSGFVLARHESAVRDFHDPAQVRDTYYRTGAMEGGASSSMQILHGSTHPLKGGRHHFPTRQRPSELPRLKAPGGSPPAPRWT